MLRGRRNTDTDEVCATSVSILQMWCLSRDDSREWCDARGFAVDKSGSPAVAMRYCATAPLFDSKWPRLTWCGGLLASHIEPFDECLLWVTAWGVWESSENLHLFYRVRESYGERRLLEDAPGHLFFKA